MNKLPIAALLGILFVAGVASAALPESFENRVELKEVMDTWEGDPEGFISTMRTACEGATRDGEPIRTKLAVSHWIFGRPGIVNGRFMWYRRYDPTKATIYCTERSTIRRRYYRISTLWKIKEIDLTADELTWSSWYYSYRAIGTEFPLPE